MMPCEQCRQPAATRFQHAGDARWRCAKCAGVGIWAHDDRTAPLTEKLEEAVARAESAEQELREARVEIADLKRRLEVHA